MNKPLQSASPYIHARYAEYRKSKTLRRRLRTLWWKIHDKLFTGEGFYASETQEKDNWPFAIWVRRKSMGNQSGG